jgi:hypothetical protein
VSKWNAFWVDQNTNLPLPEFCSAPIVWEVKL